MLLVEKVAIVTGVGAGLGKAAALALAREVVTRNEGRLTVETTSESGTTFRVWLPRI